MGNGTDSADLHACIVGSGNLKSSLDFYQGTLGYRVVGQTAWQASIAQALFGSETGRPLELTVVSADDTRGGRIGLLNFENERPRPVRQRNTRRGYGLVNVNYYVNDIHRAVRDIKAAGHELWSEPVSYTLDADGGQPIEVIFDGPDSVVMNLVQLGKSDPDSIVGRMKRFLDANRPFSPRGFTNVATSQHCVLDMDLAIDFYVSVLGWRVVLDEIFGSAETNRMTKLPASAKTRVVFVEGSNPLGKVALTQPINYHVKSLAERTTLPAQGYLAQAFLCGSVEQVIDRAERLGAKALAPKVSVSFPGLTGPRPAVAIRHPASGALQLAIGGT